jgi:hydroxyacylglutathione hydrolase
MIRVETLESGLFDVRGYLVTQEGRGAAAIVDPTDGVVEKVSASLEREGVRLEHILLTHEHCDHITGVERLRARWGARLVCTRACSEAIQKATANFSRYLFGEDIVCGPADLCADDLPDGLVWHDERVGLLRTPGHSPGSMCFDVAGALFTGDTILAGLKTVTKLPGGDRAELARSVDDILSRYSPGTEVFPGHGAPFLLGEIDRAVLLGRRAGP